MADNVNITVQDTINDIVVNAAVVVETIDINVQAAVDVVDIVANPNNYVVNINRIIGEQVQSDWTQTDNQAPDYIKNKPTIPAAQVNSDWDATTGVAEILNKPTIPTATSDLTNDGEDGINPFITAADIPPVTGFVPYTGATEDVDLGEFEIKAGQVTLDTSPTGTAAVATTRWNNTIGSSETTLKGGNVVLKNGVDLVARVVNKVTPNATLLRANYTAVRVSGAQGQRLAVAYAQANSDNNSADTIGVVCEDIATNQEGFIMTVGQFLEINTTGSLQGETWADGDVLYLSPTTAGKLTNIKPTGSTGHIVVMGYVEYAHAIHGSIYVKIMNGWELDELHNVYITSPANNQGLFYDSADSLWKNETIASALGYTPVTDARTISTTAPLSGGGDLSANRTLSITQATTSTDGYLSSTNWNTFNNKFTLPSFTSGSVLFSNGTTIAQDNSNLFWDDTNNRLGIGTNAPAQSLHIAGNINSGFSGLNVANSSTGNAAFSTILVSNDTGNFTIQAFGSGYTGSGLLQPNSARFRSSGNLTNGFYFGTGAPAPIILFTADTEKMRIFGNGNVAINTTTDAGYKLDVNGTARVSDISYLTLGARIGTTTTAAGIFPSGTSGRESLNLRSSLLPTDTGNDVIITNGQGDVGNTSSIRSLLTVARSFAPTSGTGVYNLIQVNPTINQTGGASGITRGLYINPTLTAAADFRAIESSNGRVVISDTATVKGTNATSLLDLSQTWNTTGTPTAIKLNITDTASASLSDLISLQVGGSARFRVLKSGYFVHNTGGEIGGAIVVGSSSISASAQLEVTSVTRGFLPPRMTNAQRLAIASPAVGLMVYCTDMVEGLYVNKSTGWTFVI